jgi:hypothetical protein
MKGSVMQLTVLLLCAGLPAAVAHKLRSFRPGSLLSSGLLLLLLAQMGTATVSQMLFAIIASKLNRLRLFFARSVLSLGIAARFNSIMLLLHHSFKLPDGRAA